MNRTPKKEQDALFLSEDGHIKDECGVLSQVLFLAPTAVHTHIYIYIYVRIGCISYGFGSPRAMESS